MIFVDPLTPEAESGLPFESAQRAPVPEIDNCDILTRYQGFAVPQGVTQALEFIVRDRDGNPVDLSAIFTESGESSISGSESSSDGSNDARVVLRMREAVSEGFACGGVIQIEGEASVPASGVIKATLTAAAVEHAGVYEIGWAIQDASGTLLDVSTGLLGVERSLFPAKTSTLRKNLGPPTIKEIRMRLMDSSANENPLLQATEFKDEQILLATIEPVRFWNETLPPIRKFTSRDFPFRSNWIAGILAQLHLTAANHYRRNRLLHSAGGLTVDDLNKFKEYTEEGMRLWKEFCDWVSNKKVSINLRGFVGANPSPYANRNSW